MAILSSFTKLLRLLFVIYAQISASKDQELIKAQSGQNVTLTCRAPNNNIIVVEWNRSDLGEEYVLLYRDEQLNPDYQHPSFKNRVDLQDRQMKDGDVSLILSNVTINDAGTYECRVAQRKTNRRKRANLKTDPISIIYLHVAPPGQPGGDTEDGGKEVGEEKDVGKEVVGLIVGLSVSAVLVLVVAFAISFIHRKHKQQASN